jgi:trans-aconitate methyltransferase
MPLSDHSHRPWLLARLQEQCDLSKIKTVVDIGAGLGGYREFLQPFTTVAKWTAIEIYEPYVDRFLLRYRYAEVIVGDVRKIDPLPEADIYILGDVVEHMPRQDAYDLWERSLASCWRAVLALPIIHYPQGELEGNPYEAHLETWSDEQVWQELGGCINGHVNTFTGTYLAKGGRELS